MNKPRYVNMLLKSKKNFEIEENTEMSKTQKVKISCEKIKEILFSFVYY